MLLNVRTLFFWKIHSVETWINLMIKITTKQRFYITVLLVLSDLNIKALNKITTDGVLCHYKWVFCQADLFIPQTSLCAFLMSSMLFHRNCHQEAKSHYRIVWAGQRLGSKSLPFWTVTVLPLAWTCIFSWVKEK